MAAISDVSVLESTENLEKAKRIVPGPFYFPSHTYTWLSREKVVLVREFVLTHSLVSKFLREGEVIVAQLPEILEEVARHMLFELERKIPLTDLRVLLLSSHMHLPLLTLDRDFPRQIDGMVGCVLWKAEINSNWLLVREAQHALKRLSHEVGRTVLEKLDDGISLDAVADRVKQRCQEFYDILLGLSKRVKNGSEATFELFLLDICQSLKKFREFDILPQQLLLSLCEKTLSLIVSPPHNGDNV